MGVVAPPSDAGAGGNALAGELARPGVQLNPNAILDSYRGMLAARNQQLQNQQLEAKRTQGQVFQGAIDPKTGLLDLNKYGQLLKSTPGAAFGASQAMQGATQNATTSYQYHLAKLGNLSTAAGTALAEGAKNPAKAYSAFKQGVMNLVITGTLTGQEGAQVISQAPTNPQKLLPWLQTEANQLNSAKQAAENIIGSLGVMNTGAQQVPYRVTPYGPPQPAGVPVQNQLSPSAASQMQTVVGPDGRPYQVQGRNLGAAAGFPGASGNPLAPNMPGDVARPTGVLGGGAPIQQQPLPPVFMGTGRPQAGVGQSAPSALPSTPPGLTSGVVPGPAPGTAEALKASAQQNAAIGTQIIGEGSNVGPTIANLEDLGAQIDDANPGPLADPLSVLGGAAQELGITVGKQATAKQVFAKMTNLLATQNLTGLGEGTDEKLMTVLHATPNAQMTRDAAKTVVATALGLQKYRAARYDAYREWLGAGHMPSQAAQFNAEFQKNVSPLVLALPEMPQQQQMALQKYILSQPKGVQAQFAGQIQYAQSHGLLP